MIGISTISAVVIFRGESELYLAVVVIVVWYIVMTVTRGNVPYLNGIPQCLEWQATLVLVGCMTTKIKHSVYLPKSPKQSVTWKKIGRSIHYWSLNIIVFTVLQVNSAGEIKYGYTHLIACLFQQCCMLKYHRYTNTSSLAMVQQWIRFGQKCEWQFMSLA